MSGNERLKGLKSLRFGHFTEVIDGVGLRRSGVDLRTSIVEVLDTGYPAFRPLAITATFCSNGDIQVLTD